MKTTKLNISFFNLLKFGGQALAFLFFNFSISFAQMTVKDGDDNDLMIVNDYGTTGTVTLPPFGAILPSFPINNYMLYNIEGTLYWNGSALGTSNNAGGWTHSGTNIYNTTLTDKVLIGTDSPNTQSPNAILNVYGSALFRKADAGLELSLRNSFVAIRYENIGVGSDRMRIYNDKTILFQNVGIGYQADDPVSILSVGGNGDANATISGVTTTGWGVYGEATTGVGVYGGSSSGYGIYGFANGATGFAGYFSGRGYFNGNVGIGQPSPAYKLHVKDDQSGDFVARIENNSIGTNADGLAILINVDVPGNGNHFIRFQKTLGNSIGSISGNGNSVNYNTTSDARLKTNILDYSNALNVLSNIGVKKYERIAYPGIKEIGVMAQELQKVYPQAVSGSPDSNVKTDPMMVDYSKLTPLLVRGIQEQQETIKTQDERIKELEKQNTEIKSQNSNLENRLIKIENLLDSKRYSSVSN